MPQNPFNEQTDLANDLRDAVTALQNEAIELCGSDDEALTDSLKSLMKDRRDINRSLIGALKEGVAILEQVEADRKEALATCFRRLGAFVTYARGTQALVARLEAKQGR